MASKLNEDLVAIVMKRNELSRLTYNNPEYDEVEDELHQMEDQFVNDHGKILETALTSIHEELCPGSEVLLPIAYLAKKYIITKDSEQDRIYIEPPIDAGVIIDIEEYPEHIARLVMTPNPVRILLQVNDSHREEVWNENSGTQA